MTSLDALLGTISKDGVELELGSGLNFSGAVTLVRNASTGKIDVTITGGGGSAHTIENNGSALVQRASLNFVGFTVADVAGKSTVTLPAINLATGVTGQLATANHADDSITYAKMQNVSAASRLIGRGSASGAGDPQELDVGVSLAISGTQLQRAALTGDVVASANSNALAFASGNFVALNITTTGYLGLAATRAASGSIRGGTAFSMVGVSLSSVDCSLVAYDASTNTVQYGPGNVAGISGFIQLVGNTGIFLKVGTGAGFQVNMSGQMVGLMVNAQYTFGVSAGAPALTQQANTTTNGVGTPLVVAAQPCTGTGTTTGGALALQGGTGTVGGAVAMCSAAGAKRVEANDTGLGFFGTTPIAKPTITGAKGGNAALADLLTKLASMGLFTDSST